ncbi:MAG: hypothetical protein KatS3mg001_587 [Candidatus Pacearchaeota archaeon]|nr:MAG: hypothetical protein KatS3mg001_587 [Candidatus Pacearchaeota archaeon]
MKNLEKKARAYALKNSLSYGGKASINSVISSLFHEGLKREELKEKFKEIEKIVNEVNSLSIERQKEEFEKLKKIISERKKRVGLPSLPKAKKGKVIMRFAPSASGPLHIGHALTASLSYLFVKKYGGKFYVRIEDTNPENVFSDSYEMIKEDCDWLFKKKYILLIQSDRMPLYYSYAEKLIKRNSAYVCSCPSEKFKEYVQEKRNCPCRSFSIKENLQRWKNMLNENGFNEGEAVLRFKSNMKDKNPAMRDFPLARINLQKHPRQGKKYRVWPLMNFAVAVDDIELKMTHVIRAKDHRDNAKRQKMIYNALGKKTFPWTAFLGRIHFRDFELSTTKMREGIVIGYFSGWDDEKLPTLISLRKQGYKPEAFWKFAERIGFSESDKIFDKKEFFTLLKSFNK